MRAHGRELRTIKADTAAAGSARKPIGEARHLHASCPHKICFYRIPPREIVGTKADASEAVKRARSATLTEERGPLQSKNYRARNLSFNTFVCFCYFTSSGSDTVGLRFI